jgi:hypothetical protein
MRLLDKQTTHSSARYRERFVFKLILNLKFYKDLKKYL